MRLSAGLKFCGGHNLKLVTLNIKKKTMKKSTKSPKASKKVKTLDNSAPSPVKLSETETKTKNRSEDNDASCFALRLGFLM
jgi:hypothetical protein